MKKNISKEPQKESNQKKQSPKKLISKLLGKGVEKAKEFKIRLSRLNLNDLASLTQLIGGIVNAGFLTISAVISELKERARKQNSIIFIFLDDIKVGEISSDISEEEENRLLEMIVKAVKDGASVRYVRETKSTANPIDDKLREEVNDLQKEIDAMKQVSRKN